MSHHVLLLGGHGKIAQLLTPLLLQRSWTVTSVIRAQDQVPTIERLGAGHPGKLNVLVSSLDDINTEDQAAGILKEVKPDFIAWSAGAGGKGPVERTYKIDRDAAKNFIDAAASFPSVTRFLLISYIGSRSRAAPWWNVQDWETYHKTVNEDPKVLADYYKAKLPADIHLYEKSRASNTLVGIDLRPGRLTEGPASRVTLGKTPKPSGENTRETVAKVADALLATDGVKNSWLDLSKGTEEIDAAVSRVIQEGVDASEGEPFYQTA